MSRILLALAFVVSLVATPAAAQTRTVVVPAGSAVVIAPRGQAQPRPSLAAATPAQRRVAALAPAEETLTAPGVAVAAGLTGVAALAIILGGGGSGSGGGGASAAAAPARTR